MSSTVPAPASRLARLARPQPSNSLLLSREERCELCGELLPEEHRHVADIQNRALLCACRGCAVLLGRPGAGGGHFRLVPERRQLLDDFRLEDERWAELQLPVELAFFFRSTPAGRVVALYPSPLGATESQLGLETWEELERDNPVLRELEPDVEALLVNRTAGARDHFLVPIDDCYSLVALVRTHWKGLAGGPEVRGELARFFERLRAHAGKEAM
jgi:Family of unknown function (DUF5947)